MVAWVGSRLSSAADSWARDGCGRSGPAVANRLPAVHDLTGRFLHRNDIQGLRAVAVLVVLLHHADVPLLSGGYIGVDVFFVLSGFLITQLLLSRASRAGYVSFADFYTRRARRILPAAALTLVATIVASYFLLNVIRAKQVVIDSIWASLFAANVHFAREGTDYFAQWQPPSPIQHYWTLAVEEQFYLVWPAVVSLVLFGSIRRRRSRSSEVTLRAIRRLLVVATLIAIGSLAWSIHSTPVSPTDAYFSTFTRAWELALGAMLVLVPRAFPTVRVPEMRSVRVVVGWAGLLAIAGAAVFFSPSTQFPGYAALLPTIGTALVLAVGVSGEAGRYDVGRLLAVKPMLYIGDRSYALYLWHWPVLTIGVQYSQRDVSTGGKLLLVLISFVLSVISYRLIENPARKFQWPTIGGVLMWPTSAAVVVVAGLLTLGAISDETGRLSETAVAAPPAPLVDPLVTPKAASAQAEGPALPAVLAAVNAARRSAPLPKPLTPPVGRLLQDGFSFESGCAPDTKATMSKICPLGDQTATKVLVVMGDSFAQQWMPAIIAMAEQDGWIVHPIVNGSGCAAAAWLRYPPRPWCPKWYRWALAKAKALRPDATLIAGEWGPDTPPEAPKGAIALMASAKKFSKSVIAIGVPPFQERQPVDCLLSRKATMKTCTATVPEEKILYDLQVSSYARRSGIGFIDTKRWFCARISSVPLAYSCPLVINRTITRSDLGHVTATYVTQLTASFRSAFRRELFR